MTAVSHTFPCPEPPGEQALNSIRCSGALTWPTRQFTVSFAMLNFRVSELTSHRLVAQRLEEEKVLAMTATVLQTSK